MRAPSARKARARKRGFPLSVIILRYFAYVLASLLVLLVLAYVSFGVLLNTGAVHPADYGEVALQQTSQRLSALSAGDEAAIDVAIPSSYRWAVFAGDGRYLEGDAPEEARAALRALAFGDAEKVSVQMGSTTRYEPVTLADGSLCVLAYGYLPQFSSKALRDALPNPQTLFLGTLAVLAAALLAGVAVRAARVLGRKMAPLSEAARRIKERDLDFEVGGSGVREIDGVLGAIDEMRSSLKGSLEAQWRGKQAQREQVAALAHDLKTPLTVVRGNVDLLLEGHLTDDQRVCARAAAEGVGQMGRYLGALIDLSREGPVLFAPLQQSLRPVLDRLRAQAEALSASCGVGLAWSEGEGLPESLRMDAGLVERAVTNVVANAVEHAPEDSAVEVEVRAEGGELALSVSDAGPGFSPETLRRGRERFYQGDPARAARGHSGLGLHVSAEAAALHGGSVELANREGAPGARVTLRLPMAQHAS